MGQYYVFSDESGHWNQTGYYVRSWVILKNINYEKLKIIMNDFKRRYNMTNELKFNENHDYSCFNKLNFDVYFTVTKTKDFNDKEFKVLSYVNDRDDSFFKINQKSIKKKIINSIKNTIFFNIYEFYHIKNALSYIHYKYRGNGIKLIIDTPQSNDREWKKMFDDLKPIENYVLKIEGKSENSEGIQFADILAGNLKRIIKNSFKKKVPINDFDCKVISNFDFYNSESKFQNNPQIVMWDNNSELINSLLNMKSYSEIMVDEGLVKI